MSQLLTEIQEQPCILERLLREGRPFAEAAARHIQSFAPDWVQIAARGSSDNAARYGQYLLGAHNQLGVALAVPSLITLYGVAPCLRRALVIGISQSGQSPDIIAVLAAARSQGGLTLALTNAPESPLARVAEHVIPLLAGVEQAIAATKTYAAQLMGLAMLSSALAEQSAYWRELAEVPERVQAAIEANPDVFEQTAAFADASRLVVLGRGFNYSTAFEIALKLKETSYIVAEPYSAADLLHGPVAMIDRGFPVLLVAPSGRASADTAELLTLLEQRAARVIALSDQSPVLDLACAKLRLPEHVPEWVSPLVAVVPGQLWAHALARRLGRDPDRPRGLAKVTRTR